MSDLARIEALFADTLAVMAPARRRSTLLKIARILQGTNAASIAAQREADGTPFAPRQPIRERRQVNRTLKFLYPSGGSGEPRRVLMKRWKKDGDLYTGWDIEAAKEGGGERSFEIGKIIRHLPVSADEENRSAGRIRSRMSVRRRAMFRGLRRFARLQAGADDTEAWAGFTGVDARIARVHQEGGLDRAAAAAPLTRYQVRRLLGLSPDAERQILDLLVDLAGGG